MWNMLKRNTFVYIKDLTVFILAIFGLSVEDMFEDSDFIVKSGNI